MPVNGRLVIVFDEYLHILINILNSPTIIIQETHTNRGNQTSFSISNSLPSFTHQKGEHGHEHDNFNFLILSSFLFLVKKFKMIHWLH